ncbi:MAG: hypothetical protein ACXVPX_00625 [Actinomycetota bacterium]
MGSAEGRSIRLGPRPLRLALGVASLLVLTACTIGGPNPPVAAHTTSGATGGGVGSAAVSAAVRQYFVNVIGPGDWVRMAQESTGNLAVLAGWLQHQGIVGSESSRGAVVIQQERVTSVSANDASVALTASRTTEGYRFDYTGTVTLTKTSSGWKVSDYFMNGQSVANSVFPNVSGGATSGGVTINPVGVQLLPGQVNVWAEIVNKTSSQLAWNQPIVLIDPHGRQRGHGALYVSSLDDSSPFVMTGNVSAFGDFAVGNATLPLSTKTLTLVAGATPQGSNNPVELRVPIRLG